MLTLGLPIRCGCLILSMGLALLAVTGCESNPRPRPTAVKGTPLERLDRFAIDPDALKELGYRIDWRSAVPIGADPKLAHIDAYDDIVVVQTADTLLSVLDSSTGAVRHSNELRDAYTTLTGNTRLGDLVVSSTDSEAFFIDPVSGDLLDRQRFNGVIAAEPAPIGSVLMATTNEGVVLAHTTASGGYPLWRFGTRNPVDAPVTLSGSVAMVVTRPGRVVTLDAGSGTMLGENSIFMGPEGSDPVASDTTFYIASPDQSVYAFDRVDLTLLWRYRTALPLTQQITLIDSVLYVPTADKGLLALDADTGKLLWAAPEVTGEVLTQRDGRLFVWADGRAWSLTQADGTVVAAHDLPGVVSMIADRTVQGSIYAVSRDNIVARLVDRR